MRGKPWTADDLDRLRAAWPQVLAGRITARELAAQFPGRSKLSLHRQAQKLGVSGSRQPCKRPDNWEQILREKLAEGWHDSEIAALWGIDRRYLGSLRQKLGLPASGLNDRLRQKVAAKTREQCEKAGVRSLAEVRGKAYRDFSISHGWPTTVRPRGVQILELLIAEPCLTRRQICDRLGLMWISTRRNGLKSNDNVNGGTYLSNLMHDGLVIASPRIKYGAGKGQSHRVYSASPLALQMKAEFLNRRNSDDSTKHGSGDTVGQPAVCNKPAGPAPAAARRGSADRRTSRQGG